MIRTTFALRAGVSLAAIMIAASPALAQSTLPPPDAAAAPAAAGDPGDPPKSSSPARASAATRSSRSADRLRRRRGHRQDRPQLDQRRAPAPAELGRRPQQQVQQSRQPRQSARWRRRRCRRGRDRPSLPRLAARARAGRWHALRQRRFGVAACPGSTDLNAIPESAIERIEVLQDGASAIYGSDAIAGVVNIITKRSQDGFDASAQLGGYDEGDGFTQNYQVSWGNGSDGPLEVVVGGNYVKQDSVRADDRDISRFPVPYSDTCNDGAVLGLHPEWPIPVQRLLRRQLPDADRARARAGARRLPISGRCSIPPTGSTSGRSTTSKSRSSATALSSISNMRSRRDINFSVEGDLEPAKVEEPGCALAVRHRADVRPDSGCSSAIGVHATNPVQSVRGRSGW